MKERTCDFLKIASEKKVQVNSCQEHFYIFKAITFHRTLSRQEDFPLNVNCGSLKSISESKVTKLITNLRGIERNRERLAAEISSSPTIPRHDTISCFGFIIRSFKLWLLCNIIRIFICMNIIELILNQAIENI